MEEAEDETLTLLFMRCPAHTTNLSATQGARPVPHGLPVGFADHASGLPVFRDVPRDRAVWRRKDRGSIPARYLQDSAAKNVEISVRLKATGGTSDRDVGK